MRYVSLDIETSGLDKDKCEILSIGAIIEDTTAGLQEPLEELPRFYAEIWYPGFYGEPYALNLNKDLIENINYTGYLNGRKGFEYTMYRLCEFLKNNGVENKTIVAGKNAAGFDLPFIKACLERHDISTNFDFGHRVLDIGSMYFEAEDEKIPDLKECLKRASVNKEVSHNALEDAYDVILCERAKRN